MIDIAINRAFAEDVLYGLSQSPKRLSSKYFYDTKGDALFAQIMDSPEYYLTNCEFEIISQQTPQLVTAFGINTATHFDLIELGAGNGKKTLELLKFLCKNGYDFTYKPIDISANVLVLLEQKIRSVLPEIQIEPLQGEYFEVLQSLGQSDAQKIVLFLGSNIGNLLDEKASQFVKQLSENLVLGDKVLIGVDLIKSEKIILPAYNDSQGLTRNFNLNLLERINRELGGNFDLSKFEHVPYYKEKEGIAKSYLKSLAQQDVFIEAIKTTFSFDAEECIHTEISRKYNDKIMNAILSQSSLEIANKFVDSKLYFADYLAIKV